MKNPNIAIYSTRELAQKNTELQYAWEHFVKGNPPPGGNPFTEKLREIILQSWQRCQALRVDPGQKETKLALTDKELTELLQNSQLYRIAKPIIDDLSFHLSGTGYIVTLCDQNGRIIYLKGERRILNEAEKMNFVPGADWSEQAAGTNAIGTSIVTKQPTQIFSAEHFCQGCHPWTCSSAPILHPFTNEVLGALDLTGLWPDAQPHTLATALSSAFTIQQQFQQSLTDMHHYLVSSYDQAVNRWPNDGVLLLNPAMEVVKGDPHMLKYFQLSKWKDLQSKPEFHPLVNELVRHSQSPPQQQNNTKSEVELPAFGCNACIERLQCNQDIAGYLIVFKNINKINRTFYLIDDVQPWQHIVGQSNAIKNVIRQCQKVAHTDVPVLLTGESGTGKEKIARTIHEASPRKKETFLAINCGAIPKELMASEMFGYEPGTFTGGAKAGKKGKFEEADGGTLFLDEIGEMPLDLQVYLLRVLQESEVLRLGASAPRRVNVRIIAATNKNLEEMVREGRFRKDLYYRLNVVDIHMPPLRERKEDIPSLAHYFLKEYARQHNKNIDGLDESTLSLFESYSWPGNIRELQNVIQYAVIFAETAYIQPQHLPSTIRQQERHRDPTEGYGQGQETSGLSLSEGENDLIHAQQQDKNLSPLEIKEKKLLLQLLDQTNWNLSAVAKKCNIARTTLYRKIKKYGLR
ncbi:transcriptional regulator of acetoin/glycerol metabolism [Caldalkalibacillus uzonensis]|uniref:Transcriptional regulator of acetoin/glycerol metabolism n=1 Tax=Caldalkalibacillus uzonensis TaxID=353224 RepID=A0ABU0CVU2_9BACI|nr:sigma-54-dependent Fis family transcriptional regulator [Caldalkalibacillus uzonensis]MDQ0340543.1 transcriptional regulator of acetoin/glycerol metabolism [Caldalkalibacillus uzonensis]